MELQFLTSQQIDKQKWDECLNKNINGLIYASYYYLNHMADNWGGIIGGDYDLIMPVAWRKKFGIKYCYHVPFIQQLGVFGENIQREDIIACMNILLFEFKYGDYALNFMNDINDGKECTNYVLSLASNFRSTSEFYSDKLKSDLAKTEKNNLEYTTTYDAKEIIDLFLKLHADKVSSIQRNDYKNFYDLCKLKQKENNLIARKVLSNNIVLAACLLIKDSNRLYNLMSCTTDEGRSKLAGHFLYDNLIKEFSQTGLKLDFEGSEIPGVAHFYKSFGAINQPYKRLHFNRLPFPLNIFKR